MNRLAIAHGRRVVSIAATLWVLTTLDVSAQIQMPAANTPATSPATPSFASGQKLVGDARLALARKDYQGAVQAYRKAATIAPLVPQITADVTTLRKQLEMAGIDGALLAMPATQPSDGEMQRLPSVSNATPISAAAIASRPAPTDPVARKREAMRLIAIGRAALDRGDAATALAAAKQAQSYKVPEKDFAPGEPRVWQLLLDAESAARRSGVALTSGQQPLPGFDPVQQAVGGKSDDVSVIAQMLFAAEAGQDATGDQGAIRQVQNEQSLPFGRRNESWTTALLRGS